MDPDERIQLRRELFTEILAAIIAGRRKGLDDYNDQELIEQAMNLADASVRALEARERIIG